MANVIVHLPETDRPPPHTICFSHGMSNITDLFVNIICNIERAKTQLGKIFKYYSTGFFDQSISNYLNEHSIVLFCAIYHLKEIK